MRTVQDMIDEVRRVLNDRVVPYRTSDEALANLINSYFVELFRLRPDAYVPYSLNMTLPSVTPGTFSMVWPVGEQFFQPGVYHVVGHVELQDDEHVDTGRAYGYINRAVEALQAGA